MTDEVPASEAQKTGDDTRIQEVSREAAAYRTARNSALRRAFAYETMLRAHGVDVSSVTDEALAGLPIREGRVDGSFSYTPPKVEVPKAEPAAKVDSKDSLTLDDIRRWPAEQINARWDEVSAVMANSGG